ncbi:hypothetical protein F5Y16DRAFT_424979 [Xylariaceae sp. FL0255]|nr:hypothetical protein F5Y16DRAFT_424979 [Xylariaceae sp. FL0255]
MAKNTLPIGTTTTNTIGCVSARDSANVHIGNTTHNHYLGSDLRNKFLRGLCIPPLPYEDRKNRNPERAEGTCEWFTCHPRFHDWQNNTSSSLLWVSADPGCGKSVLSRYLVDNVLPPSKSRATCYFFFKDDFDDQRSLEGALRCLLHQLFKQRSHLLFDNILQEFATEGEMTFASFYKLWKILLSAAGEGDQIVCILDGLAECVNPQLLIKTLARFYKSNEHEKFKLKFIVTSQPYHQIRRGFYDLIKSQPTIHLAGESQKEVNDIADEITLYVIHRINGLSRTLGLSDKWRDILIDEFARFRSQTYLWAHLVLFFIEDAPLPITQSELRSNIRNLPLTVEAAYNKILSKSHNPDKTQMILQVITAASRPMSLSEIAVVLTFRADVHLSLNHLGQDIPPLDLTAQ